MGKKSKQKGRFVLQLEYDGAEMEKVERAIDAIVKKGAAEIIQREPGMTQLGKFKSKSVARRIGEGLKVMSGSKTEFELKIRELR